MGALLLAAYGPCLNGAMLWDDAGHITRAGLQPLAGLWRIWFDLGATQQYYPLLHSFFWLLHRLVGDQMLAYHLTTLALHGCAAWLVARVATRLAIPGAVFAAFLFAIHPIQVESVAWVSETKNTLSAVFFLFALDTYLVFDDRGAVRQYVTALGLFVCALLSKSVTATLPLILLLCLFYRRGRITRLDLARLTPFVLLAMASGVLSVWVEAHQIGAAGEEFHLSGPARSMLAGAVPWFYLSKILWPSSMSFFYPRWDVASWTMLNALPMIATAAVVCVAFALRGRTRAFFTAVAAFLVALAPAAGFVNVYPFKFSYVANHFSYLATAVVFVAAASLMTRALRGRAPSLGPALGVVLIGALAVATNLEARPFVNDEALYRHTLQQNPHSVIARSNLAALLLARATPQGLQEAETLLRGAMADDPADAESAFNLALALERLGRHRESADRYRALRDQASTLNPVRHADVYGGLGRALAASGDSAGAIEAWTEAIRVSPGVARINADLGLELARAGQSDRAKPYLEAAARLDPSASNLTNLGAFLLQGGDLAGASTALQGALRIDATIPQARFNYALAQLQIGEVLRRQGNVAGARAAFEAGLPFAAGEPQLSERLTQGLRALGR